MLSKGFAAAISGFSPDAGIFSSVSLIVAAEPAPGQPSVPGAGTARPPGDGIMTVLSESADENGSSWLINGSVIDSGRRKHACHAGRIDIKE
jgi:hypothetical protein